ncbi:hypothetical protein VMUT_2033 [Vulcanisaeta moutnovskia 768-28]|uniref:Uncharacterized protein n=1 Tax=Vulcanisaeta moutnovskia (strain 768-28) TaxID=985053 RepID=F0QWL3_VULM7|nr:hypothetical protein [Vulcanisaeta moutnovskia]ADY02230.1 hypothetical protein VMUT_2033 [Vulcanisaeta moutnovskia 768-28]
MIRKLGFISIVLAITIVSIILSLLNAVQVQPSPVEVIKVGSSTISYYSTPPLSSMVPGLVIRIYLANGSSITPVNAFVSVYASAPSGVVPIIHTYGNVINIPFNNSNWAYVVNRWLGTGMSVSGYNTSLLVFITYLKNNDSWTMPMVIPYNVGWALAAQRPGLVPGVKPMYILATVYINVSSIRPFKIIITNHIVNLTDPEIFGTYNGYTVYNCSLSGPQPNAYMELPYEFWPESTCVGINGSLPLAWVTWSNGVLNNDKGLGITLAIDFSGTINWNAMATGYGDIGASYSTQENWVGNTAEYVLGSQISESGSIYYYYEDATWAIVRYSAWYVDPTTGYTEYLGTTTVSEVLYVPRYDAYNVALDYGNGTISLLYYGAVPLSEEYFGYSALNASSVVDYTGFEYTNTGSEYLYECNGPVGAFNGYYQIQLSGVNTAYGLSAPQLGTGLAGIVLGLAALIPNTASLDILLSVGGALFSVASMLLPLSTSSTVQQTWVEFFNVGVGTNLYISVVDASQVYGLPTFGFILNATNYYGNPQSYTCKYGEVFQIG